MNRKTAGRVSALLLAVVLGLLLAACTAATVEQSHPEQSAVQELEARMESYEAGYADGYAAGYAVADDEQEPVGSDVLPQEGETDAGEETVNVYDSAGFVLITDVIPDAILEIRYYSTFNFVGERIDGYEAPVAYLTREAAQALAGASQDLMAQGYRIKIYDAYRPQSAVDHFKAWAADVDDVRMQEYFYPELDKSVLFEQGYIAAKSGHSRGSTVDLTLVDMKTGRDVDMGGGFDYFGRLSHPAYTQGLTQEQIDNRNILRDAMTANGFKAINTEWWHFTLKNEPYPNTYFDFPVALPNG